MVVERSRLVARLFASGLIGAPAGIGPAQQLGQPAHDPRRLDRVPRPRDRDPASVASALIKRLIAALRRAWRRVRIVVRADSGICRPRLLCRLERWGVHYAIGSQKNERLKQRVALAEPALVEQWRLSAASP